MLTHGNRDLLRIGSLPWMSEIPMEKGKTIPEMGKELIHAFSVFHYSADGKEIQQMGVPWSGTIHDNLKEGPPMKRPSLERKKRRVMRPAFISRSCVLILRT
jgi:hypothetical protein